MKRIFVLFTVLSMCLSLTACGSSRESAKTVVDQAIKAFQSLDQEETQQYWEDTDFTETSDDLASEDEVYNQELLKKIAEGLTYTIIGSSEDEDARTATVTVEFTNIDMASVMSDWIGDMISQTFGYAFLPEDQQPTDEELNQMYMDGLEEAMDNHADDKVTSTVDISLSLVDNEWKINTTDDVVNAMVGGMMDYADSLGGTAEDDAVSIETKRVNPAVLGDYVVEIKSAVVVQDYDGNPTVVITYSWTNNSSETTSPMLSISTAVFQDGVGMNSAFIYDDPAYDGDMYTTDVRPGTTVDVQEAFELNNTTSPIEVEITEAFAWEVPVEIAYETFEIS